MIVRILGTGNAFTRYVNSSIMIDNILVDCGPSVVREVLQYGFPENIILTHGHGDHILGLPILMLSSYFSNRKLNIYAQGYVIDRVNQLWEASYPEISIDHVNFIELKDRGIFKVNNLIFQYESRKHVNIQTLVYRVGSFVYATDVEETEDDWEFYRDAKIVIHEFGNGEGHTPIEVVLNIKDKAKVGKLYLTHYPDDNIKLPIMNRDDIYIARPGDIINI